MNFFDNSPIKDWKGNEVKVGDTVLIVTINNTLQGGGGKLGIRFYDKNGNPSEIHKVADIPLCNTWEIHQKSKILPEGDIIGREGVPINMAKTWLTCQPWDILCIEGVSDNEEEYFKSKNITQ